MVGRRMASGRAGTIGSSGARAAHAVLFFSAKVLLPRANDSHLRVNGRGRAPRRWTRWNGRKKASSNRYWRRACQRRMH